MSTDQFRSITLQQLEALVCLVEERSFSLAGMKMMLTQPSLSKHIRNLEAYCNRTLIKRNKAGISLTEEGTILYGYAKRILRLRDEAREKINLLKESAAGLVFAGASTIPATYILPSVLKVLRTSHPDIRVHLTPGDSDNIVHMVLSGQVEVGFMGKPVQDRRLLCERIWSDELMLVAQRGHRFGSFGEVSIHELASEPFIIREKGSGTRSVLDDYLKEYHHTSLARFNVVSELGSSEAVKEAVITGLGVSIISIHAVRREIAQRLLIRIPILGPRIERSFFVIRKNQFSPQPHHNIFLETARAFQPDSSPAID
jgi:DNA-binding transcriptional LysR family regulator